MSTEEKLEQFVSEVDTMLNLQQKYFRTPKDAPEKFGILKASKAQEGKVRQMIKDHRDEQQRKLEPSLFD